MTSDDPRPRWHRQLAEQDFLETCRVFASGSADDTEVFGALGEIELTAMMNTADSVAPWALRGLSSTVPALLQLAQELRAGRRDVGVDADWIVEIVLQIVALGGAAEERGRIESVVRGLIANSAEDAAGWVQGLGQAGFDVSDLLDHPDAEVAVTAAQYTRTPAGSAVRRAWRHNGSSAPHCAPERALSALLERGPGLDELIDAVLLVLPTTDNAYSAAHVVELAFPTPFDGVSRMTDSQLRVVAAVAANDRVWQRRRGGVPSALMRAGLPGERRALRHLATSARRS